VGARERANSRPHCRRERGRNRLIHPWDRGDSGGAVVCDRPCAAEASVRRGGERAKAEQGCGFFSLSPQRASLLPSLFLLTLPSSFKRRRQRSADLERLSRLALLLLLRALLLLLFLCRLVRRASGGTQSWNNRLRHVSAALAEEGLHRDKEYGGPGQRFSLTKARGGGRGPVAHTTSRRESVDDLKCLGRSRSHKASSPLIECV
jgi:hypothetical protein